MAAFALALVAIAVALMLLAGPSPGQRWRVARAYVLLTAMTAAFGAGAFLL